MVLRKALVLWICLSAGIRFAVADDSGVWAQYQQLIRTRHYASAATLIQPMAAQHNPEACYQLAQLYRNGKGVREDQVESRRLLADAAGQEHVDSLYLLGSYYAKGIGGEQDLDAAQRYWQKAAAQGHTRAEKALAQMNFTTADEAPTPGQLRDAARNGDIASLQRYARQSALAAVRDDQGNGLLSMAIQYNQTRCSEWLLDQGLGINQQNSFGETPLHLAVRQGNQATVNLLLKRGAEPDRVNQAGRTALYIAVEKQNLSLATTLLEHQADAYRKDRAGLSAVELVQRSGTSAMKQAFARLGVTFNAPRATQQRLQAAKSLKSDNESLFLAVERDDLELLTALLPVSTPWGTNKQGHTLITTAALTADSHCLAYLLQHNQQTGLIGPMGRNALFYAITSGSVANLELLLKADLNPLQEDEQGLSPVRFALDSGSPLAVSLINSVPQSRWRQEWIVPAAEYGQTDILGTLFQSAVIREHGWRGFQSALNHGREETADWLLQHNKNLNFVDEAGDTALHWLANTPYVDMTDRFLSHDGAGNMINHINQAGFSALHLASRAGQSGQVKLLIQRGADIDIKDHNGNTPLMLAVLARQNVVVGELLAAGAEIGKRNVNKQNALAMARQLGYDDIEKLIDEASANQGILSIFK